MDVVQRYSLSLQRLYVVIFDVAYNCCYFFYFPTLYFFFFSYVCHVSILVFQISGSLNDFLEKLRDDLLSNKFEFVEDCGVVEGVGSKGESKSGK
jgi:hypothetical protein